MLEGREGVEWQRGRKFIDLGLKEKKRRGLGE